MDGALRAYLVLIGCAFRVETISDGELTQAIQCGNQLVLHRALKYVVRWCTLTNQPHIASLVVESITGMPAPSFFGRATRFNTDRARTRVVA